MYLQDIPKVAALKRSAKGAMSSSFRRARCPYPSIIKNSAKMQYLSKLFQVLTKPLSSAFPK